MGHVKGVSYNGQFWFPDTAKQANKVAVLAKRLNVLRNHETFSKNARFARKGEFGWSTLRPAPP